MRYVTVLFCITFFFIQCKQTDRDIRYGQVDQSVLDLFGNKNRDYEHDFSGGEQVYILLDDDMLGCINLRRLIKHFEMEDKFSSFSIDQFISRAIKKEIVFNGIDIKKRCDTTFFLDERIWTEYQKIGFPAFKSKYSYGSDPLKYKVSNDDIFPTSILYVFFINGYYRVDMGYIDENFLFPVTQPSLRLIDR